MNIVSPDDWKYQPTNVVGHMWIGTCDDRITGYTGKPVFVADRCVPRVPMLPYILGRMHDMKLLQARAIWTSLSMGIEYIILEPLPGTTWVEAWDAMAALEVIG